MQWTSHQVTLYNMNKGTNLPGWYSDGNYSNITQVVI